MVILVAFSFMVEHLSKSDFFLRIFRGNCFHLSSSPDNTGVEFACLLSVCVSSLHKECVSVFVMVVIPVTHAPCVTSLGTGQTFFSCSLSAMCLCAGVSHRCAEAESGVTGGEECLCVYVF